MTFLKFFLLLPKMSTDAARKGKLNKSKRGTAATLSDTPAKQKPCEKLKIPDNR
jgi:hypothetical protein